MISYLTNMRPLLESQGLTLIFNTVRGVDDAVGKNTKDNLFLIVCSIGLMVLFCAVCMTVFGNRVKGHFILSLFGILSVTLGIGAGFGLVLFVGKPYVGFIGVLPFLILGIGIDDMFIILHQVDVCPLKGADRLGKAMRNAGLSITMTTATDLVAFIIGTVSRFPGVRLFCIYAFLSILFSFVMLLTLFLTFISYDIKRIELNRQDCFPCISGKAQPSNALLGEQEDKSSVTDRLIYKYGEVLMKTPVKVVVIIAACILLGGGIYGTLQTDFTFDYKVLGADDTEYVTWIKAMEKNFPLYGNLHVDIVLDDEKADYTSLAVQQKFLDLDKIVQANQYFKRNISNWMSEFVKWRNKNNVTNIDFYTNLQAFLAANREFRKDIVFNSNNKIQASRIHTFTKKTFEWVVRKEAMLSIRKDLKEKSKGSFYPVTFAFIYASSLVIIVQDTLTNIAVCCGVILLITLPYVIKPVVSVLLLFSFACFILELLATMYLWNLSLNLITMIVMVMAIGFTVDYSCHITHAYLASNKSTPEKRIVDSMVVMGVNVLKGGLSTLVGIIVLSFSSSKLFVIFFKMMFTIIVLGLVHGLVILPVLLTIFCRTKVLVPVQENDNKSEEKDKLRNGEHDGEHLIIRSTVL